MPDMVVYAVAIILFSVLVIAAIKMIAFLKYRSVMNARFPGPPAGLVFGNVLELMREGGFSESFFDKLHDKYGDVVRFWLMGKLNISLRNPQHLAQIHSKALIRPRETKKIMAFLGEGNLLFMEDMDEIKELRMRLLSFLNSSATRQRLIELLEKRLDALTDDWDGKSVDLFGNLSDFLYHINATIFFGEAWMNDPRSERIYRSHEIVLEQYTRWSMVPFPAWHNADYRKFIKATKEWWKATEAFVDARRATLDEDDPDAGKTDLLAALLTTKDEQGRPAFTRHEIATHVIGILNGSFDTTRATLTWVLTRLAENPDLQDRLRTEIRDKIKENPAITTFEISMNMELLDSVLKESMRMISTVGVIQRANYEEDMMLDQYQIPKGVTLNLAYQQSFQVPEPYGAAGESTESYCPARFMGKNDEAKACRESHRPFGAGQRQCVGNIYARVEIKAILVYLLQRFEWDVDGGKTDIPREVVAGVIQPCGPIKLRFRKLQKDG